MKKIFISFAILGFSALNIGAYEPTVQTNMDTNPWVFEEVQFPPRTFTVGWDFGSYVQGGVFVGRIQNNPATMRLSGIFDIGLGVRYQFNPIYSIVFSTGVSFDRYRINHGINNEILGSYSIQLAHLPGDLVLESEKFNNWAWNFYLGNRFYFDRNRQVRDAGAYFELGAYAAWVFSSSYTVHWAEGRDIAIDVTYRNSNLFSSFDAGAQVAIGWTGIAVFARYRLTNPFNSDITDAQLPRFSFGLRLGF